MARKFIDPDLLHPSSKETLPDLVARVVASARWHENVSDVQTGILTYAADSLLPALGDLALRLRGTGAIELADGTRLVADPTSPSHHTDLLLTRPGASKAHHVFIIHKKHLSEQGIHADAVLRKKSAQDVLLEVLNPSKERRAFDANPAHWRDPRLGDEVARIGATLMRLTPRDGFASFRPASIAPQIWWPGMSLNLSPSIWLHPEKPDEATHMTSSNRSSEDPYEELRLLRDLSNAVKQSGLGHRVEEQIERLDTARWLSHGKDEYEARIALGMRLVREAGGYVDDGIIAQTSLVERQVFARLMEDQIELLRILGYRLITADMTRADDAFECNDGRDCAWAETKDGQINLHLRNQSGTFTVEFGMDRTIRILKGVLSPSMIETLEWHEDGYISRGPEGGDSASIRLVRDRNAVLLSSSSIACQMPSEHDGPSP